MPTMTKFFQKTPIEVSEELIDTVLEKVNYDLPKTRGETITRVFGFPLPLEQCTKEFLAAFVDHPRIVELMNRIYDLDLISEFYISQENWEIRLKYSNRDFAPHKMAYRFKLASKGVAPKASRKKTHLFG